jgi:hypothetical protein
MVQNKLVFIEGHGVTVMLIEARQSAQTSALLYSPQDSGESLTSSTVPKPQFQTTATVNYTRTVCHPHVIFSEPFINPP